MGEAKKRGTFEERRAQAFAAGRVYQPKQSAVVMPSLGEVFAILLSIGAKKKAKAVAPIAIPASAETEAP